MTGDHIQIILLSIIMIICGYFGHPAENDGGFPSIDRATEMFEKMEEMSKEIAELKQREVFIKNEIRNLKNERHSAQPISGDYAFAAILSHDQSYDYTSIVFDSVISNYGGGYSDRSGFFTAPAPGVYHFEAYVMSKSDSNYMYIRKNGDSLCRGFISTNYPYSTGFCSVNVEMLAGDQVHVEGSGNFNGDFCGFSGFMLKGL